MNSNQLTDYHGFDTKRIIFSRPEVGNIPGSKLTFKRIRITVRNRDGTIGDLILATPPDLYSFGLQETTDQTTGKVNGYQFPISLWNRNGPSGDERLFTDTIHMISDACKSYLVDHRDEIEKYDLELNDLKKFNPLYYKMEKGKIVEGRGPMLYIKTMTSKKNDRFHFNTFFIDEESLEVLPPLDLLGKRCLVQGAVKIESIFIGTKISLQTKLYEAKVNVLDTGFRSLLNPSFSNSRPLVQESPTPLPREEAPSSAPEEATPFFTPNALNLETESEDENESSCSEEEDLVPPPPMTKPIGRRVSQRKK